MSNYKTIANSLIKKLYNHKNAVVVEGQSSEPVIQPKVMWNMSSSLPHIPYIIPDECYRPEILVAFDFTYTFTTGVLAQTQVYGERVVSPEVLLSSGKKLYRFFKYYYEYAMSYSQGNSRRTLPWQMDSKNEFEINYFLNQMVNRFLMGVSVERSIGQIGQCTVRLTDNSILSNGKKGQLFWSTVVSTLNQLFVPMVPVCVWAKGRLYKDYFFPIFHGYVNFCEPANSAGFPEMAIRCKDILEWARVSQEMVNPALVPQKEVIVNKYINIISTPLTNADHKNIVKTMFTGGNLKYNANTKQLEAVQSAKSSGDASQNGKWSIGSLGDFQYYDTEPEQYSDGTPGQRYRESCGIKTSDFSLGVALKRLSHDRKRAIVTWGNSITPYRVFETSSPPIFFSEFENRLSILQSTSQLVYFEFYVDGYGDVQYHPMRLANKYLSYLTADLDAKNDVVQPFSGTQCIGPEEIFSMTRNINVDELTTYLIVTGRDNLVGGDATIAALLGNVGAAADWNLMKKFGYRRKELKNSLLNYGKIMLPGAGGINISYSDFVAHSLLQYMNSELSTVNISMVFRPELLLAAPVFIPFDNDVYYIRSISHSVTINGEATTVINGNFGRKDREMPPDLMSFMVMSEKLHKNKSKTSTDLSPNATTDEIQQYYRTNYGIDASLVLKFQEELEKHIVESFSFEVDQLRAELFINTIEKI